jgi:cytochrome c peroxidase
MDALAAYIATLAVPVSPYAPSSETDRARFVRGEHAFRRWGCAVCHVGEHYTDGAQHNSNIGDYALERRSVGPLPRFDTPTILGAWATAPYFHDGSADRLIDTFFATGFHDMGPAMSPGEVDDLVYYMMSVP